MGEKVTLGTVSAKIYTNSQNFKLYLNFLSSHNRSILGEKVTLGTAWTVSAKIYTNSQNFKLYMNFLSSYNTGVYWLKK